jgi:hypothetical protein
MALKVIGAGLGRTGTTSLRTALSILLRGRCYHFEDVISTPAHASIWTAAIHGERIDWDGIYAGYSATTDWPGAAFWKELSEFYPESLVLLSYRRSSADWFESVKKTIEPLMLRSAENSDEEEWHVMTQELLREKFVPPPFDRQSAERAYESHNELVKATVAPSRLVQWGVGDGWEPLCRGLGVPVPDLPFPHENTRSEFRASMVEAGFNPPPDSRGGVLLTRALARLKGSG